MNSLIVPFESESLALPQPLPGPGTRRCECGAHESVGGQCSPVGAWGAGAGAAWAGSPRREPWLRSEKVWTSGPPANVGKKTLAN